MFSGKTGFACDSVLEFEVVLASGEVVRANTEANSDLWIALRGGLNNFGIVTSLKLALSSLGISGAASPTTCPRPSPSLSGLLATLP